MTTITAFVVPFSSLSGFISYFIIGHVDGMVLLAAGVAALAGGYLGTHYMHLKIQQHVTKRILAVILLILAVKMAMMTGIF